MSIALVISASAHASPWGAPDTFLIISRADYFRADLDATDTAPSGDFQRLESNTYFEWGLADRFTIGGKVVYGSSWLTRGGVTETVSGVSEYGGFLQYQIFQRNSDVGAVRIMGTAPSEFQSGVRPELASDGVDLEVAGLYGRTIRAADPKIFIGFETGYLRRFSDSADQIRNQTTFGVEPSENWLFLLDIFSAVSLGNADPGGADFDVVKAQPSIVYRPQKRWGLQLGLTEEVAGRNLELGRTVFLGLWTRF
ncbi:MAG: hypothetical protein AAGD92_13005 [Pseudomonadota bacterium]